MKQNKFSKKIQPGMYEPHGVVFYSVTVDYL